MATDREVFLTSDQHSELGTMAQSRWLPAGYVFRAKLVLVMAERACFNTCFNTIEHYRVALLLDTGAHSNGALNRILFGTVY